MPPDPIAVLRAHAATHGGVFELADALRLGVTRGRAAGLVESGAWVRLHTGVYAEAAVVEACHESPEARHALVTAATIVAGDPSRVAVGGSAACLLRLETLAPPPPRAALAQPRRDERGDRRDGHGYRHPGFRALVHHLPDEHIVWIGSLRCSGPARTAVDLARTSPDLIARVVALDSAARQFGVTRAQLGEVAALQRGWPYAKRIQPAIDLMDERSESVLESLGRLALRFCETPMPSPRCQAWVGEEFPEWRADFLLPELWVAGEGDGRKKYVDTGALWAEKKRQESVEDLGFTVVRFDHDQARYQPRRLAARFDAAIARARPGIGREFPDPLWWLEQRRRAWVLATQYRPWWLPPTG